MESRLFQALKAFKGADGCEANLFKEFNLNSATLL